MLNYNEIDFYWKFEKYIFKIDEIHNEWFESTHYALGVMFWAALGDFAWGHIAKRDHARLPPQMLGDGYLLEFGWKPKELSFFKGAFFRFLFYFILYVIIMMRNPPI